jgi:hypothetical protein
MSGNVDPNVSAGIAPPVGAASDIAVTGAEPGRAVSAEGPSDPVIGSFQPAAAGSGSNSQLSELAGRIKSLITEGNDAKTAAKKACAEAKDAKDMAQSSRAAAEQKYKEAGELLREAQKRALDFQGFLKDFGISRSRAYELIDIADGKLDKVRCNAAQRKRRQRQRSASANVRDTTDITDTAPQGTTNGKPPTAKPANDVPDTADLTDTAPPTCDVPKVQSSDGTDVPNVQAVLVGASTDKSSSKHKHQSARCKNELTFSVSYWGPGLNNADRRDVIELLRSQFSKAA